MRGVELRIGELAGRLDLNPKTIRYYEGVGLLHPARRSPAGYRLYDANDERRLRFIASARRAGFALGEIREMLALRDRGQPACQLVRQAIERRERELEGQIADLIRLRRELGALAGSAPAHRRRTATATSSSARTSVALQGFSRSGSSSAFFSSPWAAHERTAEALARVRPRSSVEAAGSSSCSRSGS